MLKSGCQVLLILFLLMPQVYSQLKGNSWAESTENGHGTLVVTYSENSPFVYNNAQGDLAGIEFELLQDFVSFAAEKYKVKLELEFEHLYNFESLIDTLKSSQRPIVGIASISTLEERKKDFNITDPYMPDIEIIISSGVFSSVANLSDFANMVNKNRAITVSNSTFERNILELKRDYFPDINIEYVRHVDFLIEEVSNSQNSWGYISLPNYLTYYKSGKNIRRQRFFMVENLGLSIATPLTSDWDGILNEFIKDSRFKPLLNSLIEKYLGKAFGDVVGSISNLNTDSQ